ncbi:C-C motif chemokine 3-like [Dromiciops gliroides]|uniref:C-C motif chemokine 3-like n=1 Tax=Dromiciops gliroides TaxID=33562 RepID=UPI001CC44216|nr:C-C motif chemokine 3-like [Dromiciops gliroides]
MVSLAVLSILIVSIPGFSFETEKFVKHIPNACCHSYTRQIRYSLVMDFYETSSQCLKPGIIFLTNRGRQICANPRKEWVQVYMFSLKQKKKTEEYRSQRKHFYTSVELSVPEK